MAHWSAPPDADEIASYRAANEDVVRRVLEGVGIDSGIARPDNGIRVVVNVSSARVPDILRTGYKNRWDVARDRGIVGTRVDRRSLVDDAVAAVCGGVPTSLYYGALELNGAGMSYYGDVALVLKPPAAGDEPALLYRNSYDLEREPIRTRIGGDARRREAEAHDLVGDWGDAVAMVLRKLEDRGLMPRARLITTASVSQGVLEDEDYLEVPMRHSFGTSDIDHARVTAADTTIEADIASVSSAPTAAELKWLAGRRAARSALRAAGVDWRTVGHEGRRRS